MKKTLSVSMIVRNESECIEACLNSVKGADEIVIIDTGSTDDTIEKCRKFTNKVYSDPWRDDFAYSRNVSLRKCKSDFILIIDADEILTNSIDRIKHTINEYWFRTYLGMTFEIQTGAETFENPRILKNSKDIFYIGAVHNLPSLKGSTPDLQARFYKSAFRIESGFSPSHNTDPDRTMRILLKELDLRPNDTRCMYYLAKEYMNRKNVPEAVDWLEMYRSIKYFDCDQWDNELADAMYLLALLYADEVVYKDTKWHESLSIALESFTVLPTQKECAKLICTLLANPPTKLPIQYKDNIRLISARQSFPFAFWKLIYDNCTDTGVLMRRNFNNIQ